MDSTPARGSTQMSDLLLSKVPQVTIAFWVIKVFSTTVGETAADFLDSRLGLGLTGTSVIAVGALAIVLAAQLLTRRYMPPVYWLTVVLISVVGTLLTDNLTDVAHVPLWVTTLAFALLLTVTFVLWWRRERTLSIHSLTTVRREAFYWLAILLTFALGTAVGDFLADALGLGYLVSLILFAAVIAAVAVAYFVFRDNAVACFWIAYVLTRPLGASLGDLTSQPVGNGGLGLGTTTTSAVCLAVILILTVALSIRIHRRRSTLEAEGITAASLRPAA